MKTLTPNGPTEFHLGMLQIMLISNGQESMTYRQTAPGGDISIKKRLIITPGVDDSARKMIDEELSRLHLSLRLQVKMNVHYIAISAAPLGCAFNTTTNEYRVEV